MTDTPAPAVEPTADEQQAAMMQMLQPQPVPVGFNVTPIAGYIVLEAFCATGRHVYFLPNDLARNLAREISTLSHGIIPSATDDLARLGLVDPHGGR